ncbi:ribonuclease H-like domain-containing protein [Tanacetum coccineum]
MFGLHNQINTFKHNSSSIADYYHKLNALWKQYDAMLELPKCVCNASKAFKKHNQLLKLMQFFMGVNDSYMQIRSSILFRETLPDVKSAYATISSEECHRVAVGSIAGSSQRNQASAFSGGSGLVCENYGFNGYTIDGCFKINRHPTDFGKKKSGQNFKKQSVSNNNSVGKNDIIITGNSIFEIEKFKVFLKSKFMIKDLGKLKYFLGIEVVDTDKGIFLNQRKYVLDLLSKYGMLACKPAKTPFMSKLVISNEASDKDHLLENINDYQKLMGKLIYMTNTRPDISYHVHCLSQFMHSPLTSHLKIAFKILRYLKSCPGLGVHITKTSGMFLTAYSYVDWAKCIVTRKSVTGYCVLLNNSLVSWKSKKQNTLSKSSTEAEYRALASVTSEVIWILNFLKDLQIENLLPVSLHYDSNSAIKIAANPVFHERTKHLEIDLHFISLPKGWIQFRALRID